MKVVIMAGGKGTRISSVASDIPKPMIKIEGIPVLEREIKCLKDQGFDDIIMTVSHLGNIIMDYFGDGSENSPATGKPFGVHIEYYFEKEPLGNAGALFKIKDKLTSDFLLLNADAMFDVDFNRFVAFHRKRDGLVTLFTHPNSHPYDSGLIVADKNGAVEKWLAKEDARPQYYRNRVNAGLHVINPKVLEISGIDADSVGKIGEDGKPVKVDLDRQLLKPLAGTGKMFCYDSPEYVKDMGTPERSYYSDDPNIAFVQKAGGLMTAKKAGTTTMRCKMPNGTQATCNVTVKPLATSLKLNASEIVLYIGQSFDINSSVPKGTAAYYRLYSSSNSKIAAVTRGGGVVKGVATGKATVTCTLNNGKKAICNVYIMPQSKKISNVPLIGQSKLPTGCETCSATMLLNFYGYKISETTFADKYLVKKPFGYSNGSYTGPDPNCAFVGTPYSSNSYGAYAPIMVKCMNKYLSDKSYKAVEISGKSLEYLSGKYVAQGQPIMVWATINMSPSFKTTTWRVNYTDENAKYKLGSYYTWTAGEHCLLLTGYDKDYYYFNDPWTNARTRYSKSLVNTRYNELGKQAVVMVKK